MTDIQDYVAKTVQLQRQQAGLELVTHIRTALEVEQYRRVFKGDYTDTLEVHLQADGPILSRYKGLENTFRHTELWQQKQLLDTLLSQYVSAGDIPAYTLREVDGNDGLRYLALVYDFAL